jgi:hypothetical protein
MKSLGDSVDLNRMTEEKDRAKYVYICICISIIMHIFTCIYVRGLNECLYTYVSILEGYIYIYIYIYIYVYTSKQEG